MFNACRGLLICAGGESIYGSVFPDEFHSRLRFNHRGVVACANAGTPHSNGSQFFISFDKCDWLDRKSTIFGKVMVILILKFFSHWFVLIKWIPFLGTDAILILYFFLIHLECNETFFFLSSFSFSRWLEIQYIIF